MPTEPTMPRHHPHPRLQPLSRNHFNPDPDLTFMGAERVDEEVEIPFAELPPSSDSLVYLHARRLARMLNIRDPSRKPGYRSAPTVEPSSTISSQLDPSSDHDDNHDLDIDINTLPPLTHRTSSSHISTSASSCTTPDSLVDDDNPSIPPPLSSSRRASHSLGAVPSSSSSSSSSSSPTPPERLPRNSYRRVSPQPRASVGSRHNSGTLSADYIGLSYPASPPMTVGAHAGRVFVVPSIPVSINDSKSKSRPRPPSASVTADPRYYRMQGSAPPLQRYPSRFVLRSSDSESSNDSLWNSDHLSGEAHPPRR